MVAVIRGLAMRAVDLVLSVYYLLFARCCRWLCEDGNDSADFRISLCSEANAIARHETNYH